MAQKVSERIAWAVETLAVEPSDHLLEIGCGHGVAVSLICEKLVSGRITAIDRSEKMVTMARRRNQSYVAAGKAAFHHAALHEANFGNERFNKIFAIHLNLFRKQPSYESDRWGEGQFADQIRTAFGNWCAVRGIRLSGSDC